MFWYENYVLVSYFKYKLTAIFILSGVCIQTSISMYVIQRDLIQMEHVKCIMSGSAVAHHLTVQSSNHSGGWDFQNLCEPAVGPTQLPLQWHQVFPGRKEAGAYHPSNAKVKEQVGLYLFSPSVSSWHVIEWPLASLEVGNWICMSSTVWIGQCDVV